MRVDVLKCKLLVKNKLVTGGHGGHGGHGDVYLGHGDGHGDVYLGHGDVYLDRKYVLGGAAGLASVLPAGMTIAGFGLSTAAALGISVGVGVGAGLASYSLENGLRTDRQWTLGGFAMAGVSGGVKAASTFGIGYLGGRMGGFDKMVLNPMLKGASTMSSSITYGMAKSMMASVIPSAGRTFIAGMSWYLGETLTKMLIFSSLGSGARWLIDQIFGT